MILYYIVIRVCAGKLTVAVVANAMAHRVIIWILLEHSQLRRLWQWHLGSCQFNLARKLN